MSKITVVGAGNVGATCANVLAVKEVASEVVLLDIKEGFAEGKAMDIMQTAHILGFSTRVNGVTNDYAATAGSDVVIITSGLARKPGMTREELIGVNAGIVKSVVESILQHSPEAVLVIVSNPMDPMAYLTNKVAGICRHRIIGLGGALDSSRFRYYLSQALNANSNDIEAMVIGGHGDTTMVPLTSLASYKGVPVSSLLDAEKLAKVAADTKVGGATLTGLLGTSAWMAPGAAAAQMAEAVIKDQNKVISCGVMVEGEYGQEDLVIGVPVLLGKGGWKQIIELPLSENEKELFKASADATRKVNDILREAGLVK
ncbi:MAG: malate dehydrogenase [Bacteroidales bacterium]